MDKVIAVLTHESLEEILRRGGTGHWGTKADRARQFPYAVCVRNKNHPKAPRDVPHRAAFVIGRIDHIDETNSRTAAGMPRVLIRFSDYAVIEGNHDAWGDSQNPVWYTTLEKLGVDLADLQFQPMPEPQEQLRPEDA